MNGSTRASGAGWTLVPVVLGWLSFVGLLAWYNIADADLWARLAVGASVHFTGHPWTQDVFAFTPVLPRWIDHEWGTGVVLYTVLDWCGPGGLMALKIALGCAALGLALAVGRRQTGVAAVFMVAIPCAWAVVPGYVPVIRSHAFTYALFALTLWVCHGIYSGRTRLWPVLPVIMLVWVNLHGGFVTGFAVMGAYTFAALIQRGAWRPLLVGTTFAAAVTLITPYGVSFYGYLIPALMHARPRIPEWGPMPLLGWDVFTGFRVAFLMAIVILLAGWNRVDSGVRKKSLPGLLLLAVTAWVTWKHQRHAPFFGLVAVAVLPIYLQGLFDGVRSTVRERLEPAVSLALACALAASVGLRILPGFSAQVVAPAGLFPVRECDILSQAGVSGNLAVPYTWGSYAAWRLYPRVKISVDGRYEETFPESTFEMNAKFFNREGAGWDQLVRSNDVDFVVIDHRRTNLAPADMRALGYEPVWSGKVSSLWVKGIALDALRHGVEGLPDKTMQPLDVWIPAAWPW